MQFPLISIPNLQGLEMICPLNSCGWPLGQKSDGVALQFWSNSHWLAYRPSLTSAKIFWQISIAFFLAFDVFIQKCRDSIWFMWILVDTAPTSFIQRFVLTIAWELASFKQWVILIYHLLSSACTWWHLEWYVLKVLLDCWFYFSTGPIAKPGYCTPFANKIRLVEQSACSGFFRLYGYCYDLDISRKGSKELLCQKSLKPCVFLDFDILLSLACIEAGACSHTIAGAWLQCLFDVFVTIHLVP